MQTSILMEKHIRFAPLAQLDRVAHYECEGWGFESLMAHHQKPLKFQCFNGFFIVSKL